ncbi:MAG: hypothetical protein GY751_00360 [Bacteroidetes bacterium]|nr:hypothetical protein [Bacteroidota bacterium]
MDDTKEDLIFWIRLIYLFFVFIWLYTVWYLELYNISVVAFFIVLIPLVVFATGYFEAPFAGPENETTIFDASFLAIGLLVIVPLINWTRENYMGDCKHFIQISIVAIIFTLLSVLDIWLRGEYMRLNKHIRLCFETMSVTLFIVLLYMYILNSNGKGICGNGTRGNEEGDGLHGSIRLSTQVAPAFYPSSTGVLPNHN